MKSSKKVSQDEQYLPELDVQEVFTQESLTEEEQVAIEEDERTELQEILARYKERGYPHVRTYSADITLTDLLSDVSELSEEAENKDSKAVQKIASRTLNTEFHPSYNALIDMTALSSKLPASTIEEVMAHLVWNAQMLLMKGYDVHIDGLGHFYKVTSRPVTRYSKMEHAYNVGFAEEYVKFKSDNSLKTLIKVSQQQGDDRESYDRWLDSLQAKLVMDFTDGNDLPKVRAMKIKDCKTDEERQALINKYVKAHLLYCQTVKKARARKIIDRYKRSMHRMKNPHDYLKALLIEQDLIQKNISVPVELAKLIADGKIRTKTQLFKRSDVFTDEELAEAAKILGEVDEEGEDYDSSIENSSEDDYEGEDLDSAQEE